MKRKIHLLFLVFGVFCWLTGCQNQELVTMEYGRWQLREVQSAEDGTIVACSPDSLWQQEGREVLNLACLAQDGQLELVDETHGKTYCASYKAKQIDGGETVQYAIQFEDGQDARALSGVTKYHDGRREPTMILSTEEYHLYFFAEEKQR